MRGTYLNTLSQVKFCENLLYLVLPQIKLSVTTPVSLDTELG